MLLQKIYVIAGPTASGKSELALRLAEKAGGCIFNADSMQIYRDLKILSARPSDAEMRGIEHLLYGYADAFYENNVQDWLQRAVDALKNCDKTPIFTGGTGMYLNALMQGLSPIPDVDEGVRALVRAMPIEEVKARVQDCSATDPQRLRRALEVQLSTGKPLAYFQQLPKRKLVEADFKVFFVHPPRAELYAQCNNRLIQMLQNGAIEEVRRLMDMGATGGVMKAIGVPEICAYLRKELTYDEMVTAIQLSTRHYAKRQCTWFRHQLLGAEEIVHPQNFVFTV